MSSMRMLCLATILLTGLVFLGCGDEKPRPPAENADAPKAAAPVRTEVPAEDAVGGTPLALPGHLTAEPTAQEKYDAALLDALNCMAERKYGDALGSLLAARTAANTEEVRRQIDRVRALIEQQQSADQTARDIQTVLNDGKADEAARLATAGLKQYGATEDGPRLVLLKQQADAVTGAGVADVVARRQRFAQEGEAAVRDGNLRAAALAFEQALESGDDPKLRPQLDEIRGKLARYDERRARAAELRRNPAHLDEAIAALEEAAAAWDTLQVRQDIEDYILALQKRRERISVADFEVRGEVGIPFAGRTIADELLPAFRSRYDLMERGQLNKVIDELKLEAGELSANDAGRREVGRLAKVRYLVLGSISPLGGITVHARLVDVKSGLVVQTAKVVAGSPEEVLKRLPLLGQMLMMSDEQKIALEQQLAQQAPAPAPLPVQAPLPPPPPAPVVGQPLPPPIIVYAPRPAVVGVVTPAEFDRLPLPPPMGVALPPPVVIVEREEPVKRRLLQVALHLGDNLYRRGNYREAHTQFELALSISPGEVDIGLRIERCRRYLPPPPPPPVVLVPAPVVVVVPPPRHRPRIAVLNFVVNADPRVAPAGFGDWSADHFACQFTGCYEVVDRGEVCWYMNMMNMSVRDLLTDPSARKWLGRALNVRYFAFGIIEQTASFNVSTHVVDVESGVRQGTGSIHVRDHQELKLRMGELARQTQGDPLQRDAAQKQAKENERRLNEARQLMQGGRSAQAAEVLRTSLKADEHNVGMRAMLAQAERQSQAAALEEARQREAEQRSARMVAERQRQMELAREAAAARARSEREAAARDEAARKTLEEQRERARQALLGQAQAARQRKDHAQALQALQSASALQPSDAVRQQLDEVKAEAEAAARAKVAEEQRRRQAAERKQREEALAQTQSKLAEERKQREAAEQARRKEQEARDQGVHARLLNQGQQLLSQQKYAEAVATLQNARRLKASDDVNRLLAEAQEKQAKAEAEKKVGPAKVELERKRAEERAAREKAELEVRQKQEQYTKALAGAQKALAEKRFTEATSQFQEAGKLFRTDVVLNGLKAAEEGQAREKTNGEAQQRMTEVKRLAEEKRKKAAEARLQDEQQKKAVEAKRLQEEEAKKAAEARRLLGEKATKDAEARRLLEEEQKRETEARRLQDEQQKKAAEQKRLQEEQQKKLAEARRLQEEQQKKAAEGKRLQDDEQKKAAEARRLQEEQQRKEADARRQREERQKKEAEQKRREEYGREMAQGQAAMAGKRFQEAVTAFTSALRAQPGDAAATRALGEARQALEASKAPRPAPAPVPPPATAPKPTAPAPVPPPATAPKPTAPAPVPPPATAPKPTASPAAVNNSAEAFAKHMAEGNRALAARRFPAAVREFEAALKVSPGNAEAAAGLARARNGKP